LMTRCVAGPTLITARELLRKSLVVEEDDGSHTPAPCLDVSTT
jgi:hypothetical protein